MVGLYFLSKFFLPSFLLLFDNKCLRKIIDCFLSGGRTVDFEALIEHESLFIEE